MRTSLILFLSFLLLNCSKEVELGIDIEQLKNDGVTVLKKINNSEKLNEEKALISKINLKILTILKIGDILILIFKT